MKSVGYLSYTEVANNYALPLGTLYAFVARGEIPHVRLGKRLVRFEVAALEAWIAARRRGPSVSKDGAE